MTQPLAVPVIESKPNAFTGFSIEMLTPRARKEATAILSCIEQAHRIGRSRADIRNAGGYGFAKLDDIDPVTIALFAWRNIYLVERTKPAAANAAMDYETPALVILQAEWASA